MCDKASKRVKHELTEQIKKVQKPKDPNDEWKSISQCNLMAMAIHNYYEMATHINLDMQKIAMQVYTVMQNRLANRIEKESELKRYKHIENRERPKPASDGREAPKALRAFG